MTHEQKQLVIKVQCNLRECINILNYIRYRTGDPLTAEERTTLNECLETICEVHDKTIRL